MTDKEAAMCISENIRRILESQGRNAHSLVLALECSPGTIYPIVRGEANPSVGMASRIADELGVSVDELLKEPPDFRGQKRRKKTLRKIQKSA